MAEVSSITQGGLSLSSSTTFYKRTCWMEWRERERKWEMVVVIVVVGYIQLGPY